MTVSVCVCVNMCVRVNTDLFTLAVEVDEEVAGRGNVLRRHTLVHTVDIEVETTVGIHQQTQHRPLRTSVQIRTVVLTYLRERVINGKWREKKNEPRGECLEG